MQIACGKTYLLVVFLTTITSLSVRRVWGITSQALKTQHSFAFTRGGLVAKYLLLLQTVENQSIHVCIFKNQTVCATCSVSMWICVCFETICVATVCACTFFVLTVSNFLESTHLDVFIICIYHFNVLHMHFLIKQTPPHPLERLLFLLLPVLKE